MITSIQYLLATLMGFFGKDSIKSQKGVTMVEYGMLAALIASIVVTVITAFGTSLGTAFNDISTAISNQIP